MTDPRATVPLVATGSQTVGPFFHFGLTPEGAVNAVAPPARLPQLELVVRVIDGEQQPVADAVVEIFYAAEPGASLLFARLPTQADGACRFRIARPIADAGSGRPAAAHVNLCLFARGLLRHLHTRIYFDGNTDLAGDAVLDLVPADRRHTLLARNSGADTWVFELRLQGTNETVFFDV